MVRETWTPRPLGRMDRTDGGSGWVAFDTVSGSFLDARSTERCADDTDSAVPLSPGVSHGMLEAADRFGDRFLVARLERWAKFDLSAAGSSGCDQRRQVWLNRPDRRASSHAPACWVIARHCSRLNRLRPWCHQA
jgi:hypothetical protein